MTSTASLLAQGARLVTSLVSISLTVNYLGVERFGMWAIIGSFGALLTFADLGLGNGLLNAISEAHGKDDEQLAARYVSTAFLLLTSTAGLLLAVFLVVFPQVPWEAVFNVTSSRAVSEAAPAMAVFSVLFLANLPLGVVQRIYLGYQEGYVNSLWTVVGNVFSLLGIVLVIQLGGGLPHLVLALVGAPVLAQLMNGVVLFGIRRPWLLPRIRLFSRQAARYIARIGILFFVLQGAIAVGYQSDSLVIAQVLGSSEVAEYAIPMRLFSIVTVAIGIMLAPLWPAYGEALTRGDVAWVKAAFWKSLQLSGALSTVLAIAFVASGGYVIELWVGTVVKPSTSLLLGMGVWTVLFGLLSPIAMLMNGAGIVRYQVITASLMAVTNLALSIVLVDAVGVAGAIWGTVVALTACTLLPAFWYIPRLLRTLATQVKVPGGR